MYLYYDRNGVLKEIINDAPLRQASEENKIYIYFAPNAEGVEEGSSCSMVVERPDKTTYPFATPTHIYTPTSSRETTPSECYIPVSKKRDLKYFSEFKAYKFYEFDITSSVLTLNGTYNFTAKMYQGTSEIQQLQITPFYVEDAVIADYKSIDISMFNYLLAQLQDKQGVLTAGYGITIEGNIISVDTDDIATKQDLNNKQTLGTDLGAYETPYNDLYIGGDIIFSQNDTTFSLPTDTSSSAETLAVRSDLSTLYLHSIKVNYASEPSLFFISTQDTAFTFDNTNKCINISKPVLSCYYYNFGVFRGGFTMSRTNDLAVAKNTIKFVYYIDEATDEIFKYTFSSVSQISDSVSEL